MYSIAKSKRQRSTSNDLAVTRPFGYINEDDPFEDDAKLALRPWWELVPDPDRQLTQEMVSEALWHAVMTAATGIRWKYIKAVPHIAGADRQQQAAGAMIMKMQLLSRLVMTWRTMNVVQPNPANFAWLSETIEGMQGSFQKRYGAPYRVSD